MKYISTRGDKQELHAASAIIKGIAEDGGLFIPNAIPKIDSIFLKSLINLSYQDRAIRILEKFLPDYSQEELNQCVNNAYDNEKFDVATIAPTQSIDKKLDVLELWHGPTSAFKDMALQLLPQLMSTALKKTGEKAEIIILVATSGDTGKAALEGFKDVDQIRIMVFYPKDGVSRIQKKQMVTQAGDNVHVVAVDGNFDDTQTGVKNIFNNEEFNQELAKLGYQLSSANSINWGRLVPQIVYYFSAYADLIKSEKIKIGDKVNFVVPTGNFGNILAGYYAKLMGLPINKLICASNSNNVLTEFLTTGTYNKKRTFYKTNTPSMDILISSNLERLLYHITDGNGNMVKAWMEQLGERGEYTIEDEYLNKIQETFWAEWVDDEKTAIQIKKVYNKYQYIMDTHTAVAWQVAEQYKTSTGDETPNIIVSTASPYKFNESVLSALDIATSKDANEFELLDVLESVNTVKVPRGLKCLRNAKPLHSKQCSKTDMLDVVKTIIK